MSLFTEEVVRTFVSSTNRYMFHLPMHKLITYFSVLPKRADLLRAALSLVAVVMVCTSSAAQGWEIYFGGNSEDFGHSIIQAKNHDYMIAGFSESFAADGSANDGDMDVYVIRADVDGRETWQKVYDEGFIEHGYSIIETDDNAFLIVGDIINVPQNIESNVYLLKINDKGDLLWSKQFGGPANDTGWRIIPSENDGGYLIVGRTASLGNGEDDVYLIKVDDAGNEEWSNTYGTADDDFGRGIVETPDGYLITGKAFNSTNNSPDLYLLKVDFDGNEVWSKFFGTTGFDEGQDIVAMNDGNFAVVGNSGQNVYLLKVAPNGDEIWSTTFGGNETTEAYDLLIAENGDIVLGGASDVGAGDGNIDAFLSRYTSDGNLVWDRFIGRSNFLDWAQSLTQTSDKGFAVAGFNAQFVTLFNDVTLIKTNSNGNLYTNLLKGQIFSDDNENCGFDLGELGLNEWIIKAESPDKTFFGTSDTLGNYEITIDTGEYTVSVYTKNEYWESCVAAYNVSLDEKYDTLIRNFPILKNTLCPLLEVDVSTPVAQNCTNIGYTVDYCNNGTVGEASPIIEIVLDDDLEMTNASIPFTFTPGSLYIFELDSIGVDERGSFYFAAESSCNGVPGQAYTVNAHIFPDSLCVPVSGWDLSDIKVNGYCDTDSIRFEIINDGAGNMEDPLKFIVIEDHVMALAGDFILNTDQDTTITKEATGATYRIIAEQSPGHPGNSYPTIAIEGCANGGSYTTGFMTELQEDENDPFVSIDVQEAISSTDYIFLRGYPKGYLKDGDNLIPANTPIQYHIYFQNAGTDTIQRLVIRDTLPESLELGTVVPGASSHPYRFEAYSNGVLRFTFEDLNLLPDGDTASFGYLQFKISQKPNNPKGTVIPNSAAIFLGYDMPIQTATYTHIVDSEFVEDFIITDVSQPLVPGIEVNAYPNPFASTIVFEVKDNRFNDLTLTVFDMSGQLVRREKAAGNQLQLTRGNLLAGMYAYQLEADGLLLSTGKIVVR